MTQHIQTAHGYDYLTCVILYTDKAYTKKIEKIDIDNFKVKRIHGISAGRNYIT